MLALTLGASVSAAAPIKPPPAGTTRAPAGPGGRSKPAPAKIELNGRVQIGVAKDCGSEVTVHTVDKLTFYDRPDVLCMLWTGKKPTASAKWKLRRLASADGDGATIGAGEIPAAKLAKTNVDLELPIAKLLPLHNDKAHNAVYVLQLETKLAAGDTKTVRSHVAMLVHRPKASEPGPQTFDPYVCSGSTSKYARRVKVEIPSMAVNAITTNDKKYGGDRDEMFIAIDRLGPGPDPLHGRLPHLDDYYGAKEGNVADGHWTNKNGDDWTDPDHVVPHPVLFDKVIPEGVIVDIGFSVQEQDNADLADVRKSLMEAMAQVVKAASEANNAYGAIVAGIAGLLDGGFSLIPSNSGQDLIGFAGLRLENHCGHIQTVWYTLDELKGPDGTKLENLFESMQTHNGLNTRTVVASLPSDAQFSGGVIVDWGGYTPVGAGDDFWWKAKGTGGSSYTYRVKQTVSKP